MRWHDLVRATLPLVASEARLRDVALVEPADLPGVVHADPVRLRRSRNLLSNAIKIQPAGRLRLAELGGAGRRCRRSARARRRPGASTGPLAPSSALRAPGRREERYRGHGHRPGHREAPRRSDGRPRRGAQRRRAGHGVRGQPACRLGRGAARDAAHGGQRVSPAARDCTGCGNARASSTSKTTRSTLLVRELLASRGDIDLVVADSGAAGLEEAGAASRPRPARHATPTWTAWPC